MAQDSHQILNYRIFWCSSAPSLQKKKVGNQVKITDCKVISHIHLNILSGFQWKLKMDSCSSPHSINFLIYAAEVDLSRTAHPQCICGVYVSVNDVLRIMLFQ